MKAIVGVYLLVLLAVTHANHEECLADLQTCLNIFTDNSQGRHGNRELMCLDKNRFAECHLQARCNHTLAQKRAILERMQRNMRIPNCKIDLTKPENRVRETTLSPQNRPDPSSCEGGKIICLREYSNGLTTVHHKQDICPLAKRLLSCFIHTNCFIVDSEAKFTRIVKGVLRRHHLHCNLDVDKAYSKPNDDHYPVKVSALDRQGGRGSANMPPPYYHLTGQEDTQTSKPHNGAMKIGSPQSITISTVLTVFFLAGFELLL